MEQAVTSEIALGRAICPRHAQERVIDSCARCGDYVCLECATYTATAAVFCPKCAPQTELASAELGLRFFGNMADQVFVWGAAALSAALGVGLGVAVSTTGFLVLVNLALIHRQGQTLGKMLVGTRLVTVRDQRVPIWKVLFIRGPISVLGASSGLAIVDALFILGTSRRTFHDLAAGTRVVLEVGSEHVYDRSTNAHRS
jgi:uncharacterized RDD family membrane protein YckC